MRRLVLCLALVSLPGSLAASEFDWMVREFSRESGAKQVHIPFLGLARFVVAVGHPAGTSDFKLAVFERNDLETCQFRALTDSSVGGSWKPLVRVRAASGEATNIYVRQEGKHLNILITSLDGGDATFVQVRLKPERLIKFVDEHHSINR